MYKIAVVDDEARQCRGLKNILSNQFQDVDAEAFTDAKKALQYIEEEQIKIIITDICMPQMNGLELTEQIRQRVPGAKIILLTGYAEFEYARKAIALGAFDYLLKPLNPVKLREVMESVFKLLKEEEILNRRQEKLQKQLDMTLPVYMEKILNQWVYGWALAEEKREVESIIPNGKSGFIIATTIYGMNKWKTELKKEELSERKNQLTWWLREKLEKPFHSLSFFSNILPQTMITVVTAEQEEFDYPSWIHSLNFKTDFPQYQLWAKGEKENNIKIVLGIGKRVDNLVCQVMESYKSAVGILPYFFYFPECSVLKADYLAGKMLSSVSFSLAEEDMIKDAIKEGRRGVTKGKDILNAIVERCLSIGYPEPQKLINTFCNLLQHGALSVQSEVPFLIEEDEVEKGLDYFLYKADEYLMKLAIEREEQSHSKNTGFAERYELYMEQNFRTDLSLDDIAAHFNLTPAYFSALVKEVTGISFSKSLTDKRMRLTKELLTKTEMKIYEIAEQTGYSDVKYFNRVFKKETGITPIQYREGVRGIMEEI